MNEVAPTGVDWPGAGERLERLREAVALIRELWTGDQVHFEGQWYRTGGAVDLRPARRSRSPIWIAAGGPKGARFAGAEGGLITTSGKPRELYAERLLPNAAAGAEEAGADPAGIERMIEIKLSYAADRATAVDDCRFWAPLALPAEAKQGVDDPRELARLADELDDEQAASRFICTGDPDEAVERIAPYLELGFRHLVFHSPAADQLGFLERFARRDRPAPARPLERSAVGPRAVRSGLRSSPCRTPCASAPRFRPTARPTTTCGRPPGGRGRRRRLALDVGSLLPERRGEDITGPNFECMTLLAALAGATSRASLGALVACNSYRNADLHADMARTIDHASGGRFVLGVGAGWFEPDYVEYGYAFGGARDRVDALAEALPRMREPPRAASRRSRCGAICRC